MKEEKKIGCVLTRNEGIPRGRRKNKSCENGPGETNRKSTK